MIDEAIFRRVETLYHQIKDRISQKDVLAALTEELGEYSRAVRVEDKAPLCHRKTVDEPSQVEALDLILVGIEAYISRGGTYEGLSQALPKLAKWENLWAEALTPAKGPQPIFTCPNCGGKEYMQNSWSATNYERERARAKERHANCLSKFHQQYTSSGIGELIRGHYDATLDTRRSLEFEKHLRECSNCTQRYAQFRESME